MKVLIDNGHGEETPGKRSPDGKFREYLWAREMANYLHIALNELSIDNELIVPENEDISLKERCNRVNKICDELGAKNVVLVSIHNNAAGNGSDWMNATGWEAHTTPGETNSDILAEMLYKEARKNLKDQKIRTDMSDGDQDWENNFYILKHVKCPAVLTENMFQDNKKDVEYLNSEEGMDAILKTHTDAIKEYVEKMGQN